MTRSSVIVATTTLALLAGLSGCRRSPAGESPTGTPTPEAPARKLVTGHLLGDTPVDNRVHDPHFDFNSQFWYAVSGQSLGTMWRVTLPKTPTGLPILKLLETGNERYVIGQMRGGPAPLHASVWLGYDYDRSGNYEEPVAGISGLTPTSGTDTIFALEAEAGSEQVLDNGNGSKIRWMRYSTQIDEELLGLASFLVEDSGAQALYVNGPVVTAQDGARPSPASPRAIEAPAASTRRAPTAAQLKAVRDARDAMRRRPPPQLPDPADGLARPRQ